MEKVVILGSGPAGYTAAIYAARANLAPILLAGNQPGGLLTQTGKIENFPGFPAGIDGVQLMLDMQSQAEHFGARIEWSSAVKAELTDGGVQKIRLEDGSSLESRALIVATGASPRRLGLASETRLYGHGISNCATCDGALCRGKDMAVIGGGDSAMEEALFLAHFAKSVTVVHRRDTLRASKIMAERAQAEPCIRFCWNSEVVEVLGETAVSGLKLRNTVTQEISELPVQCVFVSLGHTPNTELFAGQLNMDKGGYIEIQNHSSATNLAGVFAAGDCADPVYRQAITAAGAGCRAAMDAERYLNEVKDE